MTLYLGLMSGTSVDAIDVALVEFTEATSLSVHIHAHYTHPWPAPLRDTLLHIGQAPDLPMTLVELAALDNQVAQQFAEACLVLLRQHQLSATDIAALGSAGQTIDHAPTGPNPYTWQLGNPSVLAELTGITTVADFRRRDVAAGGQGAPLVTAFHQAAFRSDTQTRVVLNIGGIANVTLLPARQHKPVLGFDTGPGNALLDAWTMQHLGTPSDLDGQWARGGTVHDALLADLLTDPYFSQALPKTTGRDYFNLAWLRRYLPPTALDPQTVQATLAALTVTSIAQAIRPYQPHIVLMCGGGVHNPVLRQGLAGALPDCEVVGTQAYGISPDWVEAVSFAWLARQRLLGIAGNLPSVTGAQAARLLGGVYV